MFHLIKIIFYLAIIAVVVGYLWFLPKLNYIKENPGYCAKLTNNLYWCGGAADVEKFFQTIKR